MSNFDRMLKELMQLRPLSEWGISLYDAILMLEKAKLASLVNNQTNERN